MQNKAQLFPAAQGYQHPTPTCCDSWLNDVPIEEPRLLHDWQLLLLSLRAGLAGSR